MTGAFRGRPARPGTPGRRGGHVRRRSGRALGAAAVLAGAVLAGCGSQDTGGGGRVAGDTVSIVSLLPLSGPEAPVARDLVRGEKLALAQAGGRAGEYEVTMRVLDDAGEAVAARGAAQATRMAMADSQAVAVIGSLGFESAAVTVPLLNAAGLLHVSPTVGYRGFTERVAPGDPGRWYPSGRRTFRPAGADAAHAAVMVEAVRAATRRGRPRIVIERESGPDDISLARAVATEARARRFAVIDDPVRADAVIYVGGDAVAAEAVGDDLAREAPDAVVVYGDDLTRAALARRLSLAATRRAVFVSRAPRPRSTPELRRFNRAYVERFGSAPQPYAALGHAVMRSVLEGGIARAGARAGERDRVAEEYLEAPPELPAASAFRLRGGRRAYLAIAERPGG